MDGKLRSSRHQFGNRTMAHVVAAGAVGKRLPAAAAPPDCFLSLVLGEFGSASKPHAGSLGPASAFGGASEIAFHVRKLAEYRRHQAPGAGAGVGPPFAECRDHEIATGSITADATSDLPGVTSPLRLRPLAPLPLPPLIHPPGSPHGTARMP